ncbi:MAG: glycosyltransferase family 2 protein [Acidobacteria bacterium]|nr:glycosyltransferase family 2 protein [Acidobacteriota bacterium]
MRYTILVPFFNEQDNVTEMYARIKAAVEAIPDDFEFVFVDDGSTDRTFDILEQIAAVDSRVTVVKLSRNYGKTDALVAGFEQATGDYVITLDGDLQHDPSDIPLFLEKIDEGYDVVCGWRMERPGDNLVTKRLPSRIANWVMARLSGVSIHDFGGGYKAYRREFVKQLPLYGELQRFIPALAAEYGARICEVPIRISERRHGKSHYGFGRTIPVFFDLITIRFLLRYLSRPMHFFGILGMLGLAAGLSVATYLAAVKLLFGVHVQQEHGPLMILSVVLILAGLQLLSIGLLGELLVRHFHQRLVGVWNLKVLTKRRRRISS